MVVPDWLNVAIESDIKELLWAANPNFDRDSIGTETKAHNWIRATSQCNPIRKGGIGKLPWVEHTKAIRAMWALKYADATDTSWKLVLDHMIGPTPEGRGCMLSRRVKTQAGRDALCKGLPKFWKLVIEDAAELPLLPNDPDRCRDGDEARAEPFFWSRRIKPSGATSRELWEHLGMNTVKCAIDFNKHPVELYSASQMPDYVKGAQLRALDPSAIDRKAAHMSRQWGKLIDSIPFNMMCQAHSHHDDPIVYHKLGAKLLRKLGWIPGNPIGRTDATWEDALNPSKTKLVPVGTSMRPKCDLLGLGATSRTKARPSQGSLRSMFVKQRDPNPSTRPSTKPSRAVFSAVMEGEDYEYGWYHSDSGRVNITEMGYRGEPVKHLKTLNVTPYELLPVRWWGDGIMGPAEQSYPNPRGWTIGDTTLDRMTIKILTQAFARKLYAPPACQAKWNSILGFELPWDDIWRTFSKSPLLTPPDYYSAFKLAHRHAFTRSRTDAFVECPTNGKCRLGCDQLESQLHLLTCAVIRQTMACFLEPFINLLGSDINVNLLLAGFAVTRSDGRLVTAPPGIVEAQRVAWKIIYSSFIRVDTDSEPFDPEKVISAANHLLTRRLHAYIFRHNSNRAYGLGMERRATSDDQAAAAVHPLIEVHEGELVINSNPRAVAGGWQRLMY